MKVAEDGKWIAQGNKSAAQESSAKNSKSFWCSPSVRSPGTGVNQKVGPPNPPQDGAPLIQHLRIRMTEIATGRLELLVTCVIHAAPRSRCFGSLLARLGLLLTFSSFSHDSRGGLIHVLARLFLWLRVL
jgi:hypothetical protein